MFYIDNQSAEWEKVRDLKERTKNMMLSVLRYVPLVVCLVCLGFYLFSGVDMSVEGLRNFAPEQPLLAAVFMVLLYAFKSLTIFFPIAVLNILGGFLFDPLYALIVNSVGVLVELTVSYWVGRFSGAGFAEKMYAKYPRIREMIGTESRDNFVLAFLLHVVCFLPGDAVSMCFGARKMPFFIFLVASFLGVLPGMAATTLLGSNITDPLSPMFWLFVVLIAGISISSVLIYIIWRKKKGQKRLLSPCESSERRSS